MHAYRGMARVVLTRKAKGRTCKYNTREAARQRVIGIYIVNRQYNRQTIARKADVDVGTVRRTIERYESTGSVTPRRTGPKLGSHMRGKGDAIARAIAAMEGKRGIDAKAAAKIVGVCHRTIRRAAHATDVVCISLGAKGKLTEKQKTQRLSFAKAHKDNYEGIAWRDGLYVDAAPMYMQLARGKKGYPYWARRGTHTASTRVTASAKVMVYGGISRHGATHLVFVTGTSGQPSKYKYTKGKKKGVLHDGCCGNEYRLDVVPEMLSAATRLFKDERFLYVHDRASIHQSTNTMLRQKGQPVVDDWPSAGYDVMPIEHTWADLQKEVWRNGEFTELNVFKEAITVAWEKVTTLEYCKKLCKIVPQRLRNVIKANGGHIK